MAEANKARRHSRPEPQNFSSKANPHPSPIYPRKEQYGNNKDLAVWPHFHPTPSPPSHPTTHTKRSSVSRHVAANVVPRLTPLGPNGGHHKSAHGRRRIRTAITPVFVMLCVLRPRSVVTAVVKRRGAVVGTALIPARRRASGRIRGAIVALTGRRVSL